MATRPKHNLTVEEYLKAYDNEPAGRYELVDGEVVTMAAESVRHVRAKGEAFVVLREAVKKAGIPCEVFMDGVSIRTGEKTLREPDVSIQCSSAANPDSKLLDAPIILVEVISPASEFRDANRKLAEYFTIPSVEHYLIVDQKAQFVLHHRRNGRDLVLTSIVRAGFLRLDPPGIEVSVADFLGKK